MEEKQEQAKTEEKQIEKKIKKRLFIVLAVALIASFIAYIVFRGTYLEIMEIGENYSSVFWQNIAYKSTALIINFIVIYLMI